MTQTLSDKILNHLRNSKSMNGQVGCVVKPKINNTNKAWLSITSKKGYDTRTEPTQEYIICFEIEYVELDSNYDQEKEMDFDMFLVKRENYYNIKNVNELEKVLLKWLDDFSIVEPIFKVKHPMY